MSISHHLNQRERFHLGLFSLVNFNSCASGECIFCIISFPKSQRKTEDEELLVSSFERLFGGVSPALLFFLSHISSL